jgi:hypothetical protein
MTWLLLGAAIAIYLVGLANGFMYAMNLMEKDERNKGDAK